MTQPTPQSTNSLPPIGVQPGSPAAADVVQLIYARRQACINAMAQPLRIAASNRKIMAWGTDTADMPEQCKVVVNKIQMAVMTQVASHLKEPAKVTIEGVQTGEYADYYWCGPEQNAMAMGIDPLYLGGVNPTTGESIPPQPLDPQMAQQLVQMGQSGQIDPDYVCRLDDEYTAKTVQTVFDEDWRLAGADEWMSDVVLNNVVEGWQLPLYEYDQQQGHILGDNSVEQTYIDQSCTRIRRANEAGIDLYLDLDDALSKYPDQRDAILKGVQPGGALVAPGVAGVVPHRLRQEFRRPMVRKVVWWLRNQPLSLPMGVNEAVAGGHVLQGQVPDESQGVLPGSGQADAVQRDPAADLPGQDLRLAGAGSDGKQQQLLASGQDDHDAGVDPGLGGAGQPPLRPALIHPATGEEVDPAHPLWPTRPHTALRQISIIGDELVEDIVCPFPDIPLLQLRNIPVVGRPWGIGEPFNSRNLQEIYSGITTDAAAHAHAVRSPTTLMDEGLKISMEKEIGESFLHPDQVIGVPSTFTTNGRKLSDAVHIIEPPPFPESSIKIREMISDDFNEIAGRPDVTTGTPPPGVESGRAIASLQAAASEPLNFKSKDIGFMVERLAGLMLFSILNFKSPDDIAEVVSMPRPLLDLVLQRARKRPPNVKATISTGAGSVIERKRLQYAAWNQQQDPADGSPLVSGRTVREVIGVDPSTEERRNQQAKRDAGSGQKAPAESINFKDLTPGGQVQMAQQAGIQLDPNELAAKQQADQQAQADKAKNSFGE